MATVLITGAAGFLGQRLCRLAAGAGHRVVGLARRPAPEGAPGADGASGWVEGDLAEAPVARSAIRDARAESVIHAAANARTADCERNPDAAQRDNALASELVASACAAADIPLIHCSTDLVFDGARPGGMYREEDATGPVNVYGRTKLEAEQRVRAANGGAVICRLPLLVGLGAGRAGAFLDVWLQQMGRRPPEPLTLFTDEYRTPLDVEDAAAGLLLVLDRIDEARRLGGVLHLGGPERMNRYELGLLIRSAFAETLGIGEAPLTAGRQADVPMAAPRAPDVSLDSSRARGLGFSPRSMQAALVAMARGGVE
jgi:dTDP-4-dehydrorhamnose reductase